MARHEPQPLSVSQRRAQDDIALANGGRQRLTLVSAFAQQVGVEAFDVDPAAYGRAGARPVHVSSDGRALLPDGPVDRGAGGGGR